MNVHFAHFAWRSINAPANLPLGGFLEGFPSSARPGIFTPDNIHVILGFYAIKRFLKFWSIFVSERHDALEYHSAYDQLLNGI